MYQDKVLINADTSVCVGSQRCCMAVLPELCVGEAPWETSHSVHCASSVFANVFQVSVRGFSLLCDKTRLHLDLSAVCGSHRQLEDKVTFDDKYLRPFVKVKC